MRRIKSLERFLPPLYFAHRGFFLVVLGVLWVHGVLMFDDFMPEATARHAAPSFAVQNKLGPFWAWGLVHAVLVVLLVRGLYRPRGNLLLVRLVFAASGSIFMVIGGGATASAIHNWPHASFYSAALCGMAMLTSLAAMFEPDSNPANLHAEPVNDDSSS